METSTSVQWILRKQLYGGRRAGTRWVDCMAERLEEQVFRQMRRSTTRLCKLRAGCAHWGTHG